MIEKERKERSEDEWEGKKQLKEKEITEINEEE